jgi:hypothetical protein
MRLLTLVGDEVAGFILGQIATALGLEGTHTRFKAR